VETPARWRTTTDQAASLADLSWWALYQDPQLQQLIRIALAENNDLAIAVARVQEAQARYGMNRAKLFPQIGAQVSAIGSTNVDSYGFLIGLSWEIDFFGRLRALTDAARYEYLASEQTQRAVYVSLIGEVAATYLLLRDQDQRLAIARAALATRVESLRLVRRRYEVGIISELDVKEAEILVASAVESIAGLEREIAQTENRLSVLIGRPPGDIPRGQPLADQIFPPQVPAGLPSALLERRPDIVAAEERLQSANARVGAARSEFFPQISLTALYGGSTTELINFTNEGSMREQWLVNGGVSQPLFTFGRLTSNLEFAKARDTVAVEQYKQTVLTAFKDVNDALVAHAKFGEQKRAQEDNVAAERVRLRLVRERYVIGYSNFLQVLDADRSLLDAEFKLSELERHYLDSVVQLYKALGGGWSVPGAQEEQRATAAGG
jgi:multidrug efflux system outer membrane protein